MTVHELNTPAVVVCSHDCDIENLEGRAGVIVAPAGPPEFKWDDDDDRWQVLRDSWSRTAEGEYEFGNLFPLELNLGGSRGWAVVDFSRLMAVGPGAKVKKVLLAKKAVEMTDELREALAFKLAAFFGRGTRDAVAGSEPQATVPHPVPRPQG